MVAVPKRSVAWARLAEMSCGAASMCSLHPPVTTGQGEALRPCAVPAWILSGGLAGAVPFGSLGTSQGLRVRSSAGI